MAEMNKTPEEIKKALLCCATDVLGRHDGCPYILSLGDCLPMLLGDALALVRQLEAEKAQLKRERDAAIHDLKKARECRTCTHTDVKPSEQPCRSCGIRGRNYEWRGPCEENGVQKEEEK